MFINSKNCQLIVKILSIWKRHRSVKAIIAPSGHTRNARDSLPKVVELIRVGRKINL
jgi:hypothetical protein